MSADRPVLTDDVRIGMQSSPRRLLGFLIFLAVLTLCFGWPLIALFSYSMQSSLHSHIILIPFISAYLIYVHRDRLPRSYATSAGWAFAAFICGAIALIYTFLQNSLLPAAIAFSFICFVIGGGFLFAGKDWMKAAAFPFGFLFFMIPLPDSLADWLENGSKLASAECASFFFHATGTPVLRDGTIFQLPNIAIEVARECSGIRSSWVLLIASTLAAYLFLQKNSSRLILVLASIPLGFLRNGFRIAVIGLLCINFGPGMIHSPIHRQGGPLFFVLSLIPLLFLLWLFRNREMHSKRNAQRRAEND